MRPFDSYPDTPLTSSSVGLRVQVKLGVDISVRWSLSIGSGVAQNIFEALEKLMDHLTAIVFVGAALLPVPGGIRFTNTEMGVV